MTKVANEAELMAVVEAARRVLRGLNERIEAADPRSVPVFDGIVDLHDALYALDRKSA